jgi:asparagine synthase (glutamine-hydrolysing)
MCGINGIFARRGTQEPREAELLATRDAMRRRGPDGAGAWWSKDRRCALGHRRLSIIDLSDRASQPMASDDGRYMLVFNGEIYNLPELRVALEQDGARFRTTSDSEALLHLFARDGAGMLRRLRGMFAFAIWDDFARRLFLARDPYGIKPLYMADDGCTFRFASQVKALRAGGAITDDPDPAGIVGFHLFGSVPEPFTLYRAIRALPAGHFQWVDDAAPRDPEPYADLASAFSDSGDADPDRTVAPAVLDSVRHHLLADVEVGCFLSAGIDSGALLGLMRDAGQEKIRAITLGFDEYTGTAEDEVPLAADIAARYGADHIVRRVGRREFEDDLPAILDAMDQPSIDGVNTWFVAKAAAEAGLKVALSGLGGDELLAGYASFADIPRWHRRYGPFAAGPLLGGVMRSTLAAIAPAFAASRPKALGILDHAGSWPGTYLLRRGLFLPHELPGIMDPEIAREGLRRLDVTRRIAAGATPDPGSDIARVCLLESTQYLRNTLLRDADWAGMAHSLEIRVPLVDFTLFSTLAPTIRRLAPGAGKRALAQAPSVPLPEEIVARAKTGFTVPTAAWTGSFAGRSGSVSTAAGATSKGLASRHWSRVVFDPAAHGLTPPAHLKTHSLHGLTPAAH